MSRCQVPVENDRPSHTIVEGPTSAVEQCRSVKNDEIGQEDKEQEEEVKKGKTWSGGTVWRDATNDSASTRFEADGLGGESRQGHNEWVQRQREKNRRRGSSDGSRPTGRPASLGGHLNADTSTANGHSPDRDLRYFIQTRDGSVKHLKLKGVVKKGSDDLQDWSEDHTIDKPTASANR